MFEQVYDLNNLYSAFLQIANTSRWKEETQRYALYLMPNLINLSNNLKNWTYQPVTPRSFITTERGKPRWIESRSVDDRIVQRVVHDQIILPSMYNKLIYDNAASLENRGTDFFRKRLLRHLSQFASQYGTDGYILLIDFKKFFDNIRHDRLIEMLEEIVPDPEAMEFVRNIVLSNKIDVSYMTDEEYEHCMEVPFNNIEYRLKVASGEIRCTGEKYMYKSMGIGSQLSQDAGLFFPHPIDNYCKIVKSIKGYGRYMDDTYVIHHSKDFLWDLLDDIKGICNYLGIFINEKKTQIVSFKHEFTILQNRYKLHPNGSVTVMPNNNTFQRERRKLKGQYKQLGINSRVTADDIYENFRSWEGNILKNTNGTVTQSLVDMRDLYNKLFIEDWMSNPSNESKNIYPKEVKTNG